MTHDEPLPERYTDLLGPQPHEDPALARLVARLDALHAAHEPPPTLAAAIDHAIRDRAARTGAVPPQMNTSLAARQPQTMYRPPSEGRTPMPPRRLSALLGGLAALLVVGLMAALLLSGHATPGLGGSKDNETPQQRFARLGGVEVVLHVNRCQSTPTFPVDCYANGPMPSPMLDAVRHRAVVALGVPDPIVKQTGDEAITIDLPGYTDKRGPALLDQSGELDFIDTGTTALGVGDDVAGQLCSDHCLPGQQYKVLFTGAQLDPTTLAAQSDQNTGRAVLTFAFKGDAKAQFAQYTRAHIGQYLTIVLDGKIIESATIQSEIDDRVSTTGIDTSENAQQLVAILKAGAYPLPVSLDHMEYVNPGARSALPCATSTPAPSLTPTAPGQSAPPTPTPTLSGQSSIIQNVVTATGVDAQLNPTGVTSRFLANSSVYVVMAVRGIHPGESHIISVRWLPQGQDVLHAPTTGTSVTVTGDRQVFFSLVYPQSGAGTAKIYVDRPASDTGNTPNDPALAATISFAVNSQAGASAPTAPCATDTVSLDSGGTTPTPTVNTSATPTLTPPATSTPQP